MVFEVKFLIVETCNIRNDALLEEFWWISLDMTDDAIAKLYLT